MDIAPHCVKGDLGTHPVLPYYSPVTGMHQAYLPYSPPNEDGTAIVEQPSPLIPYSFPAHLERYGPRESLPVIDVAEAEQYARDLARSHYENFHVLSYAVPSEIRQDVANIYAYCRWADDLSDEVDESAALDLLEWWRDETLRMYRETPRHPVMRALAVTVQKYDIPPHPFLDLLSAFRQDQIQSRYADFEELLGYCRRSANPVGRLVLHLFHAQTPARLAWSDSICTGLQLANFCQDVAEDYRRGRIYIPQDEIQKHGVSESSIGAGSFTEPFAELMREQVDRADRWLRGGDPLPFSLPGRHRFMTGLFLQGGLAILRRIRRHGYNVLSHRPRLTRWDRAAVAWRTLTSGLFPSSRAQSLNPDHPTTDGS